MRMTLNLDEDVFLAARALARRGLKRLITSVEEDGLPVFLVPANAPLITLEHVKCMEDVP